jgi:hypothetical protein
MASIVKRCPCPDQDWEGCPHPWVVRYRITGGRSSRQRELSFDDQREAEDFALKVEHDKRAHTFVDPKAGQVLFRDAAGIWLDQHLGADSSIATYRSVLRTHIAPAIGGTPIGALRREDIKTLIARMHRKGLSASRIGCAHLVISAVLAEAVRDKKLAESPCTGIQLPGVVVSADFIIPAHAQVEAMAAGLPPDWAATIWLMHGCGLRIGEALAINLRCRINKGKTLRVKEQVNPSAQLRPLKFRNAGSSVTSRYPSTSARRSTSMWPSMAPRRMGTYSLDGSTSWSSAAVIRKTSAGPPPGQGCRRSSSRTHCGTCTPQPHWRRVSRSPRCPAGSATKALRSPTRSTATSSPPPSTRPAPPSTTLTSKAKSSGAPGNGAESVLTTRHPAGHLPAETAHLSTITQIYEGTNQIQRMVMARQLLKG